MAAPKRTKAQRELDRAEMLKLLRRGWTKARIGERLGVHRTQVDYDWNAVLKELQADRERDTEKLIEAKKEEYAEVKREAWDAWERSKEDKERRVAETTTEGGGEGEGQGDRRTKAVKAVEGR